MAGKHRAVPRPPSRKRKPSVRPVPPQARAERLAIETPAVPALPAPERHAPRSPFRREATITARAGHRTGAVVFTPDAPPARPPLSRRVQVGPVRHASPEPPAVRGPLRRFLRRRQSI